MPPRKKVVKSTPVVETPVVFILRLPREETEILPAEAEVAYTELIHPTSYDELLRGLYTGISMNTEMLKSILENVSAPEYSSDTACFWCCHIFTGVASTLPVSYDTYKNIYTCEGHFCSPECALAFLYHDIDLTDSTRWTRHGLLRDLYAPLYADKELTPAPPRTLLRLFGGPLDIAQYRAYCSANELVASALPPTRLQIPVMSVQGPIRDIRKCASLEKAESSGQLRLKRSKPIHSGLITMDSMLGKGC